jgi:hypothetical protein
VLASEASPQVAVVLTAESPDPATAKRLGIIIRLVNEGKDTITLEWQGRAAYLSYVALMDARSCEVPLKSLSSIHHRMPLIGHEAPRLTITLAPHETIKLPSQLDLGDDFFRHLASMESPFHTSCRSSIAGTRFRSTRIS